MTTEKETCEKLLEETESWWQAYHEADIEKMIAVESAC